ncbi:CRISPR-associated protein Cas5 [Corynebacterium sp. HS2168-gen11]|uniref:CRISPR-associated protein Cas5 n=1 Tax=Corynebacterium sp. HS2168-gen11 TaxID=2974027 RepID=UPI0037C0E887
MYFIITFFNERSSSFVPTRTTILSLLDSILWKLSIAYQFFHAMQLRITNRRLYSYNEMCSPHRSNTAVTASLLQKNND